ncbi:MAG: rhodanese-like domain-containing protein [Planctomycetes bacterium]|nr:rhodanese-like domain-containing protein [Planctomycetota bacterium]
MHDPATTGTRWIGKTLARCVALLLTSLVIGLVFNDAHPAGVKWSENSTEDNGSGASSVTWEEAELLVEAGEALLVDSRPRVAYDAGHIPGAVSLPVKKIGEEIPGFIQKHTLDTLLIVYCADPDCDTSKNAAKKLTEYGYENVLYIPGGYAEWQVAQASRDRQTPEDKQ